MKSRINILEIFPRFSCWYQCSRLESVADIPSKRAEALALGFFHRVPSSACHCYPLLGNAATFNLTPGCFDLIARSSGFRRTDSFLLDRKCKLWLVQGGLYGLFPEGTHGLEDAFIVASGTLIIRPGRFLVRIGALESMISALPAEHLYAEP